MLVLLVMTKKQLCSACRVQSLTFAVETNPAVEVSNCNTLVVPLHSPLIPFNQGLSSLGPSRLSFKKLWKFSFQFLRQLV